MRTPHASLLEEQKTANVTPLVRLVLTNNGSSATYNQGILLRCEVTEQVYNQTAEITLDNRNHSLDDIDYKGWKAVLSFGATVDSSDYYSPLAPMWVVEQRFDSAPKMKFLYLSLIGLPNLLLEDRASYTHTPSLSNPLNIHDIFVAICNGAETPPATNPLYPDWAPSTSYQKNDVVVPSDASPNEYRKGYVYRCVAVVDNDGVEASSGTSAAGPPAWVTTSIGQETRDNNILTWRFVATSDNPYADCSVIEVEWEDSIDDLMKETHDDAYVPADAFPIYKGTNRLAILRRLVDYSKCVMRFEGDGKIHVLQPVTSGDAYDEVYDFDTADKHPFFSKSYSQALVIPNKIVVSSREDDADLYTHSWTSSASYSILPKIQYETAFLKDNDQALALAKALIFKQEMAADGGSIYMRIMNVAQELYDFIQINDTRQGDEREGNVGSIIRRFNARTGQFDMTLSFGNWLSVRKQMNMLEAYPTGFGSTGTHFSRLSVNNLDATNIKTTNINMQDPVYGVTLDTLADGEIYHKVNAVHVEAGVLQMGQEVDWSTGYDPNEKTRTFRDQPATVYAAGDLWLTGSVMKRCITAGAGEVWVGYNPAHWEDVTLDSITDSDSFQRVITSQFSTVTPGKLELSSDFSYEAGYNPFERSATYTGSSNPTIPYAVGDIWIDEVSTPKTYKMCTTARTAASDPNTYQAGDWVAVSLDFIADGGSYKRVQAASLTAGGLVILDAVSVDTEAGTYGLVLQTDITAGHIALTTDQYMDDQGFSVKTHDGIGARCEMTVNHIAGYDSSNVVQFELRASDGLAYCGGGAVILHQNGITIDGHEAEGFIKFHDAGDAAANITYLTQWGNDFIVFCKSGNLELSSVGDVEIKSTLAGEIKIYSPPSGEDDRGLIRLGYGSDEVVVDGGVWVPSYQYDPTTPYGGGSHAGIVGAVPPATTIVELYACDSVGTSTLISPHDHVTGEWIFLSKNHKTGRVFRVAMEKLVKRLEDLLGESFTEDYIDESIVFPKAAPDAPQ